MTWLNVTEVQRHLNLTGQANANELQSFVDAAEKVIERLVGPVTATPQDEYHDGGGQIIRLLAAPVISVTAVAESYGNYTRTLTEQPLGGSTFDAYGYNVELSEGVLTRRVSGSAGRFQPGRRNIHVTYSAGWSSPPADLALAGKELVRHFWQTQRGSGSSRPGSRQAEQVANVAPGAAFALPIRVQQLLQPYLSPAIA